MMSIERELLRRISSHSESRIPLHFIKEIQQLLAQPEPLSFDDLNNMLGEAEELLAQPEQEPVAWMYEWVDEIGETVKGVYVGSHKASHLYELENLEPLYLTPPKRESETTYIGETKWMQVPEPLSYEHLEALVDKYHGYPMTLGRAIEKAHGIGGGNE
jgi:hypothetical protein